MIYSPGLGICIYMVKNEDTKKKDFRGKWIVVNLAGAFGVAAVLLAAAIVGLNLVTKHNKELVVPDFSNMTVAEASSFASASHMRVDVTDSVFVKRMKKGTVYRQNPQPGSKVKEGRRVSLTINAVNAKKVTMPNLIGYSMRQAKAELLSRGLVLGKLIYVEDIATNNVLSQMMNGKMIEPGTQIESESVIDLELGLNSSDCMTYIPDLTGMKLLTAIDAIHDNSLNVHRMVFDKSVRDYDDSLNAVVYKQEPDFQQMVPAEDGSKAEIAVPAEPVAIGDSISIYLTVNPSRIPVRQ